MGSDINEYIETRLHYKDIALIAVACGLYQEKYLGATANPDVLARMKKLVDRLGFEMYEEKNKDRENSLSHSINSEYNDMVVEMCEKHGCTPEYVEKVVNDYANSFQCPASTDDTLSIYKDHVHEFCKHFDKTPEEVVHILKKLQVPA